MDSNQPKYPYTAIVVATNEARLLERCLPAIGFCDQLLVVDLDSQDDSAAVARRWGATVIAHERVDMGELARRAALPYARHDWLLTIDPDEVAPPVLPDLIKTALQANPQAGVLRAPIQFYFAGRPLKTTVWGRSRAGRPLLFHRQRVEWSERVHAGYHLKAGFTEVRMPFSSENAIQHYWAESYDQLFEKHRRYLAHEGRSRYAAGQRFSWFGLVSRSVWDLKRNLVDYRGALGGLDGWGLSLFHAWYLASSWLALRDYQRKLAATPGPEASPRG